MSLPDQRPVIAAREDGPLVTTPAERRTQVLGRIMTMLGLTLLFVAWTHISLIIFPAHFGVAAWEFAAATQTIDVFPLAVTGISMLGYGLVTLAAPRRLTALAIWCFITVMVLLGAGTLTALDIMVAWNSVTSVTRESLGKTTAKTFLFSGAFAVYHLWLGIALLRVRKDLRVRR